MPDPARPTHDDATRRFDDLWRQATEGPKTVAVTKTKHIEIDLTPATLLKYLREFAVTSHDKGDIKGGEYNVLIESTQQLEAALAGLPLAKFNDYLRDVQARQRELGKRQGSDEP